MPAITAANRRYDGKPMNNRELADNLCASSLALREARRVHVKSYGTLIPHVFMGNVLARVGWCLSDAGAGHAPEVEAILDALETAMSRGDRETRNVISLSFVADGEIESFFELLRPLLGPKVSAQIRGD